MIRHFLNLSDAGPDGIAAMLADALDRKVARAGWSKGKADADAPLAGHVLAMVFEKNSTRTRVSFDMAIRQLGGTSIVMDAGSMQLGRGETVADTARVLSGYVDAIMIRTDDHAKVEELAAYASVPVINGLTDYSHPCQIVADLQTVIEAGYSLPGLKVAWLGDGNNVLTSMMEAAGLMQFDLVAACPQGFQPSEAAVALGNGRARVVGSAREAVEGALAGALICLDAAHRSAFPQGGSMKSTVSNGSPPSCPLPGSACRPPRRRGRPRRCVSGRRR